MAHRSDRDRFKPVQFLAPSSAVSLVGRRSADSIRASGRPAATKGRIHGCNRPEPSECSTLLQGGGRPYMELATLSVPPRRRLTRGLRRRVTFDLDRRPLQRLAQGELAQPLNPHELSVSRGRGDGRRRAVRPHCRAGRSWSRSPPERTLPWAPQRHRDHQRGGRGLACGQPGDPPLRRDPRPHTYRSNGALWLGHDEGQRRIAIILGATLQVDVRKLRLNPDEIGVKTLIGPGRLREPVLDPL
jgi:hypothetical protein